jgi:UPF0176 protein
MSPVLNIAAYQFASLSGLPTLRDQLRERCEAAGLKGTILLAPEGINLFLAGDAAAVREVLEFVRTVDGLSGLTAKESWSDFQPFRRLLVKLKREIITFCRPEADPRRHEALRVSPGELRQWLDERRDVVLLDTRNQYETAAGTFEGALVLPLDDFRRFPDVVAPHLEALSGRTVVTFCTGGIRCEKAAPWLRQAGVENVLQLDGGILKYFEECGGAHYRGECFVFDERQGLTPDLKPVAKREPRPR